MNWVYIISRDAQIILTDWDILLELQELLPVRVPSVHVLHDTSEDRIAKEGEAKKERTDFDEYTAGDDKRRKESECQYSHKS